MTGDQTFFYSVVQVFPDPARNESVNIGVIVVDEKGGMSDARFANLSRVRKLGLPFAESAISEFIRALQRRLVQAPELALSRSLPGMSEPVLSEWSREFGGEIRVTPPRFAAGVSAAAVLTRLYGRFVQVERSVRRRDRTAAQLLRRFDRSVSTVSLDGLPLIVTSAPIHGYRATHDLDRAVFQTPAELAGAAHAISFWQNSLDAILSDRAVVIVAAEDIHERLPDVPVIALLGGGNEDRVALEDETRELLRERRVVILGIDDVASAGATVQDAWRQPAIFH